MGAGRLVWTRNRDPRKQPSLGRFVVDYGGRFGARLSMGIDSKRRRKAAHLPGRGPMLRGSDTCRIVHDLLQLASHRKSFPTAVHAQQGHLRGGAAVCLAESSAAERVPV